MQVTHFADTATAAAWFAGIGGWLAAGATVWVVLVTLSVTKRDRNRLEAELKERDRAQARMVTVSTAETGTQVTVRNHSSSPIFEVSMDYAHWPERPSWLWGMVTDKNGFPEDDRVNELAPHAQHEFHITFMDENRHVRTPSLAGSDFWSRVIYTDAQGHRWNRTEKEQPVKAPHRYQTQEPIDVPPQRYRKWPVRWFKSVKTFISNHRRR